MSRRINILLLVVLLLTAIFQTRAFALDTQNGQYVYVGSIDPSFYELDSPDKIEEGLRKFGFTNDDRLVFGARVIFARGFSSLALNDGLNLQIILTYIADGKNTDVYYDENGAPLFWFIGDNDTKKILGETIDYLKSSGYSEIVDQAAKNGTTVIRVQRFRPGEGSEANYIKFSGEMGLNISYVETADMDATKLKKQIMIGFTDAVTQFNNSDIVDIFPHDDFDSAINSFRDVILQDQNPSSLLRETHPGMYRIPRKYFDSILDQTGETRKFMLNNLYSLFAEYRRNLFLPYRSALEEYGCKDNDMLEFCSKVLYAIDNYIPASTVSDEGNKNITEYIRKDQIFEYSIGRESLNVVCNPEGKPRILVLNSVPQIDKGIIKAIEWYSDNGAPDALESIYNNGLCVIMPIYHYRGRALLYECGVMTPIMLDSTLKYNKELTEKAPIYQMIRLLMVESFGIAYEQFYRAIDLDYLLESMEIIKSYLASFNGYLLTRDSYNAQNTYIDRNNLTAEYWIWYFSQSGNVPNYDTLFGMVDVLMEANLIDAFGYDSWDEMKELFDLTKRYYIDFGWCDYPQKDMNESKGDFYFSAFLLKSIDQAFMTGTNQSGEVTRYINRKDVITYRRTGKKLNLIKNSNGCPVICIANTSKKVEKALRAAIKKLEKDIPGTVSALMPARFVLFAQNTSFDGEQPVFRYDSGALVFDCNKSQDKKMKSDVLQDMIEREVKAMIAEQSLAFSS